MLILANLVGCQPILQRCLVCFGVVIDNPNRQRQRALLNLALTGTVRLVVISVQAAGHLLAVGLDPCLIHIARADGCKTCPHRGLVHGRHLCDRAALAIAYHVVLGFVNAVHGASGRRGVNLIDIVNICFSLFFTLSICQAIQIDNNELFLLLGPLFVDRLRIRVIRQLLPCVKAVLALIRQDKNACVRFTRAFRHIRSKRTGFAVIQLDGFRMLAHIHRLIRVHRIDVSTHCQRIGRRGLAVRRGNNDRDFLIAVIQSDGYFAAARHSLSAYRHFCLGCHRCRINIYGLRAARNFRYQHIGIAHRSTFERMGRTEAGHQVVSIARCRNFKVGQLGNCGIVLTTQHRALLAVHADEVAGAVVGITVTRNGCAIRTASVTHRFAHRSIGAIIDNVLRRFDHRIQMADQIVDLVIVMTGPGDKLVQIDFTRRIQRQHLVLEHLHTRQQNAHIIGCQCQRIRYTAAITAHCVRRIQNVMRLIEQQHAAGGVARHIVVVQRNTAEVKLIALIDRGKDIRR